MSSYSKHADVLDSIVCHISRVFNIKTLKNLYTFMIPMKQAPGEYKQKPLSIS